LHRDRSETLLWMDQTYNPHEGGDNSGLGHGWETHYLQKGSLDEEVTEKFNMTFTYDGDCKMVIRDETMPVGVYNETPRITTYTVNLCDIDPDSIKVKTFDSHKDVFNCSDPKDVELFNLNCDSATIKFLTRNGAAAINEEFVETFTKLTGKDHEYRNISKTNMCWLSVDDVSYAQRLAKALKHAVEVCGGKPSKF